MTSNAETVARIVAIAQLAGYECDGVVFAAYRGSGERSYKRGWRTASLGKGGVEGWYRRDHRGPMTTGCSGETDDAALRALGDLVRLHANAEVAKITQESEDHVRRAARLRTQADDEERRAGLATRRAAKLRADLAALLDADGALDKE